jgi:hypothetical protein
MLEIFGDRHLSWIDVATSIALSEQARQFRLCLPLVATEGNKLADLSTPERSCIGSPERKYINDSGKKAPKLGGFS